MTEPTRSERRLPAVYVWAFPPFVVSWPLIIVGFVLAVLQSIGLSEQTASIIWLVTLMFVMAAMGFDFDREGAVYIILMSVIAFLVGVIVTVWLKIPVLHDILGFIGLLHFRMSSDAMLMASLVLSVMYMSMIVWVYFTNRWKVTPGLMELIVWWKVEEEIPINTTHPLKAVYLDHLDRLILLNGGHFKIKVDGKGERLIGLIWGDIRELDKRLDEYQVLPIHHTTG